MIEFVFASASILADWGSWIALGLLTWLLVAISVAVPLCRRLGDVSEQCPPGGEGADDAHV